METIAEKVAGGALTALLVKMGTLLEQEVVLLAGVRSDIRFVGDELKSMNAFIQTLTDLEEPDPQVKEWMKQVRELAYDVEDSIDEFMHRLDRGPRGPDGFKGFLRRSTHLVKTLKARHQIAAQIRDLKARALEVSERRSRYNFSSGVSSSSVSIDPRLPSFYVEAANLVGIDEPQDDLASWLVGGEQSGTPPKTVSIVGFGGLGKTTLAMKVYGKIGEQFDCRSFVTVSRKIDMKKVLRSMLSQV